MMGRMKGSWIPLYGCPVFERGVSIVRIPVAGP